MLRVWERPSRLSSRESAMPVLNRFHRRLYDLAVRAGLAEYKMLWPMTANDWDVRYADGRLDFYGHPRDSARYGALIGMIREFPRKPRVLDVGCGVGFLRAKIGDDAIDSFVGIDPSAVAIDRAQERGFANSSFYVGELPTPEMGQFDIIVLNEVIYYVTDRPAMLEKLQAQVAPDGLVLTSILRHPGATALDRELATLLNEVDAVVIQRDVEPKNAWRVAAYGLRKKSVTPQAGAN
jgi:2-polyprenyl-3-methyl-5-hydroxy-6-metoxy-1,4-benzoquinol methylase